jgi:hypothetical protein
MLEVQKQRAWHDIVTLDEYWFYCRTDHESIGLRPGDKIPESTCVSVSVQSRKSMASIAWNPTGVHGRCVLYRGANSTSAMTTAKSWSHSQSGEVDKQVQAGEY